MDYAMQRRHLEEAERHVAQGVRHIAEQEERIAKMDRQGYDTTTARFLLETFRATHAQHVSHRDHILRELER